MWLITTTTLYQLCLLYLDVLDQVCCAVGHLLGSLNKVSLRHRVGCLGAGHLAGIAEHAGVLGNDSGCCQHLLLARLRVEQVLTCHGDSLQGGRGT